MEHTLKCYINDTQFDVPPTIRAIFIKHNDGKNTMAEFITKLWIDYCKITCREDGAELITFLIVVHDQICREGGRHRRIQNNPDEVIDIIKDSPFFKLNSEAAMANILHELNTRAF